MCGSVQITYKNTILKMYITMNDIVYNYEKIAKSKANSSGLRRCRLLYFSKPPTMEAIALSMHNMFNAFIVIGQNECFLIKNPRCSCINITSDPLIILFTLLLPNNYINIAILY